jgi:cobyrinic acid a,c-diamide synthase
VIFPCPRLVIAALRGGDGKTTIALSLLAAWRRQGRSLVPFKKGPDYIDTAWLALAAGNPCYNLDTFMVPQDRVRTSFIFRAGPPAQGALIEGNRGLYDGADEAGAHSTAELAKLLGAPVVLVLDTTKVTRTLAAVVLGCRHFDPEVNLAGVILNQVATARQETLVRVTIERHAGLPVLGAVPRSAANHLPERHLGLTPTHEHSAAMDFLGRLEETARTHLDLDRLWALAERASDLPTGLNPWPAGPAAAAGPVRLGVIRDSAFQFYYPENLELLERLGARLTAFSALTDEKLPEVDGLYLGGGFPETHAEALARNEGLRLGLARAAADGLPVYAECGGLMYLGRELILQDRLYPMSGVFPVAFALQARPRGHGYTVIQAAEESPFYAAGRELVGHEFHYSYPVDYDPEAVRLVMQVRRGHGFDGGRDGLVSGNVFGAYTHLHALGSTTWAESLVRLAGAYRDRADGGGVEAAG